MSRRKPEQRDALLQHLLEHRPPGGGDYFVFSIVTEADESTLDQRLTFAGAYEEAAALCVTALGVMADNKRLQKGARIELYQGEKARAYFVKIIVQESRYQRERRGEANN
jgi:hypothetical protein